MLPPEACADSASAEGEIGFRRPSPEDGPAVTALIASCPPLDINSAYCNLLQCTHFAETCVIAEEAGTIVGWISAHHPPSDPECIFVWQVAVAREARGKRLGGRMLATLVERASVRRSIYLTTTVTSDNAASWSMFKMFARQVGAPFEKIMLFDRDRHFGGSHDSEWQIRIGPLSRGTLKSSKAPERAAS